MKLLLGRSQKNAALISIVPLRIGTDVIFHLRAELELDDEEEALMTKYRFTTAPLVLSDPIQDMKDAFRPALVLGVVTVLTLALFMGIWTAFPIALLVTLVMTVVYFRSLREQIIVKDLLHGGRLFYCDSIVALVKKEAYLEAVCQYLRQVLESAKHWDEREIVPILPLPKDQAILAVLKG
jgi:hypothetical protein